MQAAKLTLTTEKNDKGEYIFEIGSAVEIKREDFKEEEKKLDTLKTFLDRVTKVSPSRLSQKFSI
jgi:hypothetical protein